LRICVSKCTRVLTFENLRVKSQHLLPPNCLADGATRVAASSFGHAFQPPILRPSYQHCSLSLSDVAGARKKGGTNTVATNTVASTGSVYGGGEGYGGGYRSYVSSSCRRRRRRRRRPAHRRRISRAGDRGMDGGGACWGGVWGGGGGGGESGGGRRGVWKGREGRGGWGEVGDGMRALARWRLVVSPVSGDPRRQRQGGSRDFRTRLWRRQPCSVGCVSRLGCYRCSIGRSGCSSAVGVRYVVGYPLASLPRGVRERRRRRRRRRERWRRR